jgi:hypothetical protein
LPEQIAEREARHFRLERAGIETRDVEKGAQDFLDRFERGVDIADETVILALPFAFEQARHVEPRGVEGL